MVLGCEVWWFDGGESGGGMTEVGGWGGDQ